MSYGISELISGVRSVVLEVQTFDGLEEFYTAKWGLSVVHRSDDELYLRTSPSSHYVLGFQRGTSRRLLRIELLSANRATVESAYRRAIDSNAKTIMPPERMDVTFGGFGFDVVDPEGRTIRILAEEQSHAPLPAENGRPEKISHVVLNSRDIQAMRNFYCGTLDFRVNDWSEDQMVFLSCDDTHHNIAFNRGEFASLNHVAFEMQDFSSVMAGVGRLKQAGIPVQWGVGSHGIADIMFAYFIDPNGFVVEYSHCARRFGSEHVAKVWPRSPRNMDAWGTAGIPTPLIRNAMAGIPDPEERRRS